MLGERRNSARRVEFPRQVGAIQELRARLFSLFIDNIPREKDVRWLRSIFNKVGETRDVFIPARHRRVSNSRFGFVRYMTLEEAKEAVRRWNGLFVGKGRLVVQLADNEGKPANRNQIPLQKTAQHNRSMYERMQAKVWKPKSRGEEEGTKIAEAGSVKDYAGLAKGRRRITLEVVPGHEEWFKLCIVGELKDHTAVVQMEEEMRQNDISFHQVISMGGKKMLIHFENEEDLEKWLTEDYPVVTKRFSKLWRWRDDDMPIRRSVWMSVTGLPFSVWSEGALMKIVEPLVNSFRWTTRTSK